MNEPQKKFKLDFRPYKHKAPHQKFFCPLCKTKRAFSVGHKLKAKNYGQIIVVTLFLSVFLYPFMGFESTYSLFVVWASFEIGFRANFRKEIPCPHCGFDASWYRKDIKVAKKLIDDFWKTKQETPEQLDNNELAKATEIPEKENLDNSTYF